MMSLPVFVPHSVPVIHSLASHVWTKKIFTVVAGEYCDVYQWSLRPPPECAVDPYIVRIKEEGGISRSVNAFCCGVAPELCFNASKTNLTFDTCCTV